MTSLPLIFGTGLWSQDATKIKGQIEIIVALRELSISILDTARHYSQGQSEAFFGDEKLASEFDIITKNGSALHPSGATKDAVIADWEQSQEALKTEKVAMYLLHAPDPKTPISETMEGIQELYVAGHFKTFGLSNFSAEQVEACYSYAKSRDYVLPTVYQSNYHLAARKVEKILFPTLRRLDITIQAYAPLGSGFLAKTPEDIKSGSGHFDPASYLGKIMQEMYGKPSYLEFLAKYGKLANKAGCSKPELAHRWIVWNSALDVQKDFVVLGASSAKQLRQTVEDIKKGPLEQWVVNELNEMWDGIEKDSPVSNYESWMKLIKDGVL